MACLVVPAAAGDCRVVAIRASTRWLASMRGDGTAAERDLRLTRGRRTPSLRERLARNDGWPRDDLPRAGRQDPLFAYGDVDRGGWARTAHSGRHIGTRRC